ncbi:MAG: DUF3486 family protein [Deltaproteobacteria bacterium]|nr:DUF3486 family protein [Deltaproteobacteria bacterium]
MGRKSTLKTLPKEIRRAVDEALREGKTIDDIVGLIRQNGQAVSRSAVGRYAKVANEQMARYKEAQEIAKVWVTKLEKEEGDVGRLLAEMLRVVVFDIIAAVNGEGKTIKPHEVMALAKAMRDLSTADKTLVDKLSAIKKNLALAADDVAIKARKEGLSEETVKEIRERVLGAGG